MVTVHAVGARREAFWLACESNKVIQLCTDSFVDGRKRTVLSPGMRLPRKSILWTLEERMRRTRSHADRPVFDTLSSPA